MWRYVAKRVLLIPVILWIIYTLSFLMVVLVPGNPFAGQSDRSVSPDVQRAIMARYHADDNAAFYRQYLIGLLGGGRRAGQGPWIDFGPSWQYRDWTCNQIVQASLPVSVAVGLTAILIALLLGVAIGVGSAARPGGVVDYAGLTIALLGISLPTFATGTAALVCFGIGLDWLPAGGWGRLDHLILPAATLSLPYMAYIARLTRLGMLDALSSQYIRTAQAKGLSERVVIGKHALRNAALPVVSFLGPAAASALTGSAVVEMIFNLPGMGQHFVASVLNRDRGLILATVLVYSAIIVVFNLVVDLAYGLVDPRVKVGQE